MATKKSASSASRAISSKQAAAETVAKEAIAKGYVASRQLNGKVVGVWGEALLRTAEGEIRPLKTGDVVKKGDVVLTAQDGIIQIEGTRFKDLDKIIASVDEGKPETAPAAGPLGNDQFEPGLRVDRVTESVSPLNLSLAQAALPLAFDLVDGIKAVASRATLTPPTVSFPQDVNGDGIISGTELGSAGSLSVRVGLPTTAKAGDIISLKVGGQTLTHQLTDADIAAKGWTAQVDRPAEGASVSATATLTDPVGNVTPPANAAAVLDTQAALTAKVAAPSDSGAAGDGLTNVDKPVVAGVGDPGATVQVTMPGSNEVITTAVAPDGTWSVTPTQPIPDGTKGDIVVLTTDPVGNTATSNVPLAVDLTPPALTAVLDPSSDSGRQGDNVTNDTTPTISGVGEPGNPIRVTMPTGEVLTTTVKADGTWSVTPTMPLPEGGPQTVSVVETDPAGNTTSATVPLTIDTTPAPLTALLDPASDSGKPGDGITNDSTPTLSGTGEPGNTVQVTMPTGEVLTTTVKPDGSWSVTPLTPLPQGGPQNVAVLETDPAGNTTSATVPLTIDSSATAAPTVTITTDTDNDGFMNKAEVAGSPVIAVSVGLPAGAKVGDTLTLTDGATPQTHVLTAADIAAGKYDTTVNKPEEGTILQVSATLTDPAGNTSAPGTDAAKLDTSTLGNLQLVITTDADNSGFINKTELAGSPTVQIAVTLPADAVAGDSLTINATGNPTTTIVLTQAQVDAKTITLPLLAPASGTELVVTGQVKDPAGNVSNIASDKATLDTDPAPLTALLDPASDSGKPGDGITNDNTPTISGTGEPGNTIQVTMPTGEVLTTTVKPDGSWSVTPITPLPEGGPQNVAVLETDPAGNTTSATVPVTIDTVAAVAPTVTITPDANNDALISKAELAGAPTVAVAVGVPAGAKTGDTLTLTDGTTPQTHTLTAAEVAAGVWNTTVAKPAEGTTLTVSATLTDAAGNVSPQATDSAVLDTTAPVAPTVTITTDTNNDGFMNKAEVAGSPVIAVSVGLPAGAKVGDTLTLTDGTTPQTHVLTAADIAAGRYDTTVAKPAENTTLDVTATLTDPAGNTSAPGTDAAKLDTSTLGNLQLVITTDADNSGFINKTELAGSPTVQIAVTLPADAVAGDSLTINATGNPTTTIVLTQAQVDAKTITLPLLAPASGTELVVTGQVKDPAGNVSNIASDKATLDTDPAPLTALLDPASDSGKPGDGITNDSTPTISGTGEPGNTIQVTMPTGEVLTTTVKPDGSWSVTPLTPLPQGGPQNVAVLETDPAGNTTSATVPVTIDTVAPVAPGIVISTDANNDGFINVAELGSNPVAVRVTLPVGAAVGDKLVVTGTNSPDQTFTLTAAQVAAGFIDTTFAAPANHTDFVATAQLTDVAGNASSTASDHAVLSLDPAGAPSVTIVPDTNNDGRINAAELAGSPTIAINVGLPPSAVAGDSVILTVNGVAQPPKVLTAADIAAGTVSMPAAPSPGEGGTLNVAAQIKTIAGNLSPTGTDSATLDTTPPPLTAKLDPASDSGVQGDNTTNDTTPTIVGTGEPGNTIKVTMPSTGEELTTTVAPDGTWSVTPTQPLPNGSTLPAAVVETDPAGNTSTASVPLIIDTAATVAPKVTISPDTDNDGYINKAELGAATTIAVAVGVPAGAKAGDTITLTDNNPGSTPQTHVLTAAEVAAGVWNTTVAKPAEGATLSVNATLTDAAGNVSAPGTDAAKLDTSDMSTLAIQITTDANNDGFINNAELGGSTFIDVSVKLPAGAALGDTLTITGSGNIEQTFTLTAAQIAAGQVDVKFNSTANNTDFVSTATISDVAGNSAGPVQDQARLQTAVISNPQVFITSDTNDDGLLSTVEIAGSPTVAVSVTLPALAKAGDTLLVSINGAPLAPIVLTQADVNSSSVSLLGVATPANDATLTVTAQLKDAAGNLSGTGSDKATTDTTPPPLTAKLDPASDSGVQGDNTTNDTTPTIVGTGEPGNTIKVTMPSTGEELTTTVAPDGTWSVTPTQPLPNGSTLPAAVVETDPAGNTSTASVPLIIDTAATVAPKVTISPDTDNDGYINKAELGAATTIAVAVGVPAGAKAGDTITLTDNNPGSTPQTHVLTAAEVAAGVWNTTVAKPAEGATLSVNATLTDAAGNVSAPGTDAATLDTSDMSSLAIQITTDANNDALISKVELSGGKVAVSVALPAGASVGDTLTVTGSGNTPQTFTLTATDIAAGKVNVQFNPTANNTDFVSTATISDPAGNAAGPVSDAARMVLDAPGAPVVTITPDVNNDGLLSAAEIAGSPTVSVNVALPATAKAGDTLLVYINGVAQAPKLLTQADINASNVTLTGVPTPANDATLKVDAQVKDAAGNLGEMGTDSAKADTTAPALTAVLDPASDSGTQGDNTTSDTTPTISGTGEPGNTIQVTMPTGEVISTTVDAAGKWSVTPVQAWPEGGPQNVAVLETDPAGNTTSATVPVTIDTTASVAPTVVITTDADNNALISAAEQGAATTDSVKVTVPATAKVGDVLTITDGLTTQTHALSAVDIANGYTTTFAKPAEGGTLTVTATLTDAAGNVSAPGSDSAKLDTTAPALTAVLDPASDSGTQGDNTTSDTTPTISGTGEPGNTIQVTMPTGEVISTTVDAAGKWSVTPVQAWPEGGPQNVAVLETDPAGNTTSATVPVTIDTTASVAPTVLITTDADNNALISAAEQGAATTDSVKITVPATAKVGDVLIITDGLTTQTHALSAADIASGYTTTFAKPAEGGTLTVTATLTDAAGNVSAPGSDSAKLDTTAPSAPTVTITTDANNDGLLYTAEIGNATTVAVKLGLQPDAKVGDVLAVTDGTTPQTHVLTAADIAAQAWTTTVARPAEGTLLTVTATLTDPAGNQSAPAADAARLETAPPQAVADTGNVLEDATLNTPAATGVLKNDSPAYAGETLSVTGVAAGNGVPAAGTLDTPITGTLGQLTLHADGSYTYVANNANALAAGVTANDTFTYAVSNGHGDVTTTTLTITVTGTNDLPVVQAATGTVSEEGLPGGIADTTGVPADTTNATVVSGNMVAVDPDGTPIASWSLGVPSTPVTSHGVAVTWTVDGTQTLVGTAGGVTVGTLTIDNSGHYTFTLSAPIDHPNAAAEDVLPISFTAHASDGLGVGNATLTINVEDDSPVANPTPVAQNLQVYDTNLLFVIDVSASMLTTDGVNGTTRLESEVASIKALLDKYDAAGDIKVRLVTFDSNAQAVGTVWTDIATAKAQLDLLAAGSATNYDEALGDAMTAFADAGKIAGAQNVAYFLSDGAPTRGSGTTSELVPAGQSPGTPAANFDAADLGIQAAEQTTWTNFLKANQIDAFALGVGSDVTDVTTLNPIAYNGAANTDRSGVLVTSFAQLDGVLATTMNKPLTGNLVTGGLVGGSGGSGADGGLHVTALTVNGVTYSYDPAGQGSVTVTGGTSQGVYDAATHTLTITTNAGGTYAVNLVTGDYSYLAPQTMTASIVESLGVTLADYDGDPVSATLTVNVNMPTSNDVPLAFADTYATNQGVAVADSVATNDSKSADGGNVFSLVSNVAHGTLSFLADGSFIYQPTANYTGPDSFTYKITDKNGDVSTATVTLDVIANVPTVTITTDANNNGVIGGPEIGAATTVAVSVGLPAGAKAGDTITVSDGTTSVPHVLTAAEMAAGVYLTNVARPAEGATLTVTATLTDALGHVSQPGSDAALLDTTATVAPTVTITTDTNNNGYINAAELGAATTIAVAVGVPAGAKAGDTLTFTDGTTPQSHVLTAADITAGTWTTTVAKPAEGATLTVTATLTDAAGNVSPQGQDSAVLDTTATAAPTIAITTDANNNGYISSAEIGAATTVGIQIGVPAGAKAGDVLNIGTGTGTVNHTLTAAEVAAGSYATTVARPAEGATLTVTATLTDAAGNVSPQAQDTAVLDTTATVAPTITITTDANNNGYISSAEIGAATTVGIQIGVPAGAKAGDVLNIGTGTGTVTHTLTAAEVTAGSYATAVARPAEGATLTVTATLTDAAGNVSPQGQDSAVLDTTATAAPTITITTDANNNGYISSAEIGAATTVGIQIGVPAGAKAGDVLNIGTGTGTVNHTLTAAEVTAGSYATTVARPAEGATLTVTVTLTDAAGNVSPQAQDTAVLDTTAPVTAADSGNALEDNGIAGNVLTNDSGTAGETITVASFVVAGNATVFTAGQTATIASVGSITLNTNGSYTFTPLANWSGTVPAVTYTAADGHGNTATAALNLSITAVADTPTLTVVSKASQLVFANSWETVANSDTTSTGYTATNTVEGWTRLDTPDNQAGGTNSFEVWSSGDGQQNQGGTTNTVVAAPGNGNNFLELNDASSLVQTIGITRTVATTAGMVYELSFDTAGRPGFTAPFTTVGVYIDGLLYKTISNTSPQGYIDWKSVKVDFTGDGANHVITIRTDATQFNTAGRGAFIDNVELIATQGVVAGNAGAYTNVHLANYVSGALVDGDGSEALTFTFSGLPTGATVVVGATTYTPAAGSVTITKAELATADLHLLTSTVGHLSIGVTDTATEAANGSKASQSATLELDIHASLTSTDLLGDGLTNYIGDAAVGGVPTATADTLTATTTAASLLVGKDGNDTLTGNTGSDYLDGGNGNDVLKGMGGSDFLYGGAGTDSLTGGTGTVPDTTTDTFVWKLADRGAAGGAVADTITDFSAATAASGGDVLDLKDILVGEYGKAGAIGNLDHYLSFQTVGTSTVIHISSTGQFNGSNTTAVEDQTITLTNVDLRSAFALPGATDAQLIQELLNRGKLITDGQG